MGLLTPWFLAGIAAVALPLWLHLLRHHKRTPHAFSSVMFFERRVQSSIQQRRLKHLLLLALRILLLTLLALAFAKPFLRRDVNASSMKRPLTVVAIDRSFSMRYGDHLDKAKAKAREVVNGLPSQALAEILAVDSRAESLTKPTNTKGTLLAAIDGIQATDQASSFGQLVRMLRTMEQTTGMALSCILISDLQQTALPKNFADLKLGANTQIRLIPISQGKLANWSVETVTAPARVYDARSARVTATIAGFQTSAVQRKASLLLDDRVIASKQVDVPVNGKVQAEFVSFDVPYGAHRGSIRIEPGDSLSNDDQFPFAIERSDARKVLYLYSNRGSRTRPLGAFYYRSALESASSSGLVADPQSIQQGAAADLSKYAFVVLDDVGALDETLNNKLHDYVERGGGLLVAVGIQTADAGTAPLTDMHLQSMRQRQPAGALDLQHSAFTGMSTLANVEFFLTAKPVVKPETRVLGKLADGSPLLLEDKLGTGRILTFLSGFDNVTNDFPLHTSFVPFVIQTGRYLAGAEEIDSTVPIGTAVDLRTAKDSASTADVVGPEGKRELSLSAAAKAVSFELDRSGFYEVQRAHGPRILLAAYADRRESDLTPIPAETLALWQNLGQKTTDVKPARVEQQSEPWELWRTILLLALAIAAAESIFSDRYLMKARQTG